MATKELPTLKDVSRIPEELRPLVLWWQDHGTKTLTWAALAVAVCVAAALWQNKSRAADAAAAVALASSTQGLDAQGLLDQAPASAPLVRLVQARALYDAGDYENALVAYDAAAAELDGDPALADIAALGRACALEALGRVDEALTAVGALEAAFAQSPAPHYLASELILAKARLLCQKGDKAAAKAALTPILQAKDTDPLAKYANRAERLVQVIDAYAPAAPEA